MPIPGTYSPGSQYQSDSHTGDAWKPSVSDTNTGTNGEVKPVGDTGPSLYYDPYYGGYIYTDSSGVIRDTNGNDVTSVVGAARREAAAQTGTNNGIINGGYQEPGTSTNNSLSVSMDADNTAGLISLGQSIANAEAMSTQQNNALTKYMWEQGEANTDRRLQQQMDFSHNEAQNAMAYQERMRNTAHQAEVADLKAAGLNPVLSANNGAQTPAGLMGGVSAVGANNFTAQKSNIVGAYSAAGQFVASMLQLQEQMREFNKSLSENQRQYDTSLAQNMYTSILGSMTSLIGKGLGAPRSYSTTFSTAYNSNTQYGNRYYR